MKMGRILLQLLLLLVMPASISYGQILTTDPAIPVADQGVTVYFDATEGNGGLEGFDGEVYAHTGVLTDQSTSNTDWRYVKTSWGENTPETKLTRISDNYYSLDITPTIRDYFGVPEGETITHLAFVFRSADNSREGKDVGNTDIFAEVFDEGLSLSIITPDEALLLEPGTDVTLDAALSESATIELYLDDALIKSVTDNLIEHLFTFDTPGDFWIKVVATNGELTVADSVFVHVMGSQVEAPVPGGLEDGINYIDDQTVQLVLHAPGKNYLYVIGDFNDWTPGSDARMNRDNDKWWITIDGLVPGMEYAYQYLVDGELRIADPYTEKVLDPWNDPWISEETYPGLGPYPGEHTSGIVSTLRTAIQPYQWEHADYTPPPKENLVIYELLVRDFIEAHDWETLTDTLDYFSRLGINAIELMPINEFEGNESWGYNPGFYLAPDKYYGPKRDLQVFIDSCHGRGIAVIQDMTLNHSYGQSPLVQLYLNTSTYKVTEENPWYNVDSPNQVYSWGYDFDHESAATQYFVDRVNEYWLTEYDIDGFRFDFTKGFTNTPGDGWAHDAARIANLKRMADQLWTHNPNAYVILEHFTANPEEEELSDYGMMVWGNLNEVYRNAASGNPDNESTDFSWISYQQRGWSDPHIVGYMESHDEERLMFENLQKGNASVSGSYDITKINTALDRIKLAASFFIPVPGPKMIWQFGELGYDFSIDFKGRVGNKPIRWDYYNDASRIKVYDVFSALIHLKTSEPAFLTNDFFIDAGSPLKRIELNHDDMDVRIIGNFDVKTDSISANFSKTGTWYRYFTGEEMDVSDVNAPIRLRPGEYRIYTTKRLETPRITSVENDLRVNELSLKVYPVPAADQLNIESGVEMKTIRIFDINGRQVQRIDHPGTNTVIDLSSCSRGLYILNVTGQSGAETHKKFIKN